MTRSRQRRYRDRRHLHISDADMRDGTRMCALCGLPGARERSARLDGQRVHDVCSQRLGNRPLTPQLRVSLARELRAEAGVRPYTLTRKATD
jgi:hypothetical protein